MRLQIVIKSRWRIRTLSFCATDVQIIALVSLMSSIWLVVANSLWWSVTFAVASWARSVLAMVSFTLMILIIDGRVGSVHHSLGVHVVVHFLLLGNLRGVMLRSSAILLHSVLVLRMRSLWLISKLRTMLADLHPLHVCFWRLDCVFRGSHRVTTTSDCW